MGISLQKKFIKCEDHSEEKQADKFISLIKEGNIVALVSDAGSPLISDPGYKVVKRCQDQGVYVTVVPGACAVICALQLSGLPSNRFMFAGFIPNRDKARIDLFNELKNINTTLIFYETAPRLLKSLECAQEFFVSRKISVIREITKLYEEVITGEINEVLEHFRNNAPKGEFVFVVSPPENIKKSIEDIRVILKEKLAEMSLKCAVKEVSDKYGVNRNDVYTLALELKNE